MAGPDASENRVGVGSVVRVQDGSLTEWWRIVPAHEADAGQRRLSEKTPLARALIGHRIGDRVQVDRPDDRWPVTILAVDAKGDWA